ncbi:MAG TPA: cobalamin-independent methionine synthase II family protein [Acidimicrobiia bacterium]
MSGPRRPARAEVIGSLLRPPALKAAVEAFYAPEHRAVLADERARDASQLRVLEDEAITEAVVRQIDAGLDVVSDGEFRRYMFLNSFWDAVDGFSTESNPIEFRNDSGDRVIWQVHKVIDRLEKVDSPAAREARFLAGLGDHPFKVTFPAGSIFSNPFTWKPGINDHAYLDRHELTAHALSIQRELVLDAVTAGARYLQFDFPIYPFLVDPRWSDRIRAAGFELEVVLEEAIAADRMVLEGIPDGMTVGLHICRGNYRSRYLCEGSLEPLAERIFNELPYDVFLVEWDDLGRMGDFSPIRFLPKGRTMAMGIVSTKRPGVEPDEELLARIDQAGRFLPWDQLAISPQCGFASVVEGNEINEDVQWEKLEAVGRVAAKLWG